MKKAIALLLALVMVFALCGCGSRADAAEKTDTAKEKAEAFYDEICIEDVKFVYDGSNKMYQMQIKARNTYTDTGDKEPPDRFFIKFQFLDENKDVMTFPDSIGSTGIWFKNYAIGQGGWEKFAYPIDPAFLSTVSYFGVAAYTLEYGSPMVWRHEGQLSEPYIASIADKLEGSEIQSVDIEPEGSQEAFADDKISVEEALIKRSSSNRIAIKVRNNGDEAYEIISLNVQILDSNGDVLEGVEPCVFNLDVGQAGKTEYLRLSCEFDKIAAIKVIGFRYGTGSDLVRNFSADSKFKLETPIIIPIEDITME